jgi:hypothetical protein
VVIYLREIAVPIRAQAGLPPSELFPIPSLEQIGPKIKLVEMELAREAATLAMLAAVAGIVSRKSVAAFSLAFGIWDLAFYGWLRVLIGWPPTPNTWDLLFLVPVPWAAPVLAPSIVALSLAIGGALVLASDPAEKSTPSRIAGPLLVSGAAVLLVSFMWDWRHWLAGGMPRSFPWGIFAAGEILGIAGFLASGSIPVGQMTRPAAKS